MVIQGGGHIEGGRLFVHGRRKFDDALSGWPDCQVTYVIERTHATRSKAQNDYYHAVIVARIAAHWKKDVLTTHEILKAQFLPYDLAAEGKNGTLVNGLVIGGSTKTLNKLQFVEYLETIVGWAAEKLDLFLPDPDPLWREHAEEETKTGGVAA